MRFSLLIIAFSAAFVAAAPAEETMEQLLARTCPGGNGNTCCPEGKFSVRTFEMIMRIKLCAVELMTSFSAQMELAHVYVCLAVNGALLLVALRQGLSPSFSMDRS